MLGRVEDFLDRSQSEERHGLRADHRLEEHVLTPWLAIERTRGINAGYLVSLFLKLPIEWHGQQYGRHFGNMASVST